MRKINFLLMLCLMTTVMPLGAHQLAGVDIPDTVTLTDGSPALVLNGAGIRKKFFMDIYVGALYLPAKTGDASAILADTGPASVLMHFLHKEVGKDKITGGWNDGLAANHTAEEMAALQPILNAFNALFDTVHEGDVIRIDHLPGSGTRVLINGAASGTVPGDDFYRALLKIWLGAHPVSKALKQGMLGRH
jgi:hypothetical protein